VDLRAAKVLAAERVPKSTKLLKLTVDAGEPAPRTILAGIAEAYRADPILGRSVVRLGSLERSGTLG
jgi:methionyl-tRNA synthetase